MFKDGFQAGFLCFEVCVCACIVNAWRSEVNFWWDPQLPSALSFETGLSLRPWAH